MKDLITIQDALIVPFLLIVVYLIATKIRNKHIDEKPYYKYFRLGLFVKIWAGLAFAAVYIFYYGGGDTIYYFYGTESIVKMFSKDITTFTKLLAGNHSAEVFSMFDRNTGWPTYFRDPNSFSVCRFNVPFYLLSFGSFLGNTIIMNLFLYLVIWQFYEVLTKLYPLNEKWLAYTLFFIPSVVFWSSGLLKDGWMLAAILGLFTKAYLVISNEKRNFKTILWIILWAYISFSIRPFMLYATIASILIWMGFSALANIRSYFFRVIAFPLIITLVWVLGIASFTQLSAGASERYSSIDAMLETAQIIQDDLKRDYYGGNSFDIGSFEPTIPGVLSKAPKAIIASIYRPFIWEGDGPLMLVSGLENFILLALSFLVIVKARLNFIREQVKQPMLVAYFILAISFAFSIGLTTSNFGALVRYAIPVKLFTVLVIAIIYKNYRLSNS